MKLILSFFAIMMVAIVMYTFNTSWQLPEEQSEEKELTSVTPAAIPATTTEFIQRGIPSITYELEPYTVDSAVPQTSNSTIIGQYLDPDAITSPYSLPYPIKLGSYIDPEDEYAPTQYTDVQLLGAHLDPFDQNVLYGASEYSRTLIGERLEVETAMSSPVSINPRFIGNYFEPD